MGLFRRLGLRKQDIADLEIQIPRRDPIAEKQLGGKKAHYGSIEAAENTIPWLRQRRRNRRFPSP